MKTLLPLLLTCCLVVSNLIAQQPTETERKETSTAKNEKYLEKARAKIVKLKAENKKLEVGIYKGQKAGIDVSSYQKKLKANVGYIEKLETQVAEFKAKQKLEEPNNSEVVSEAVFTPLILESPILYAELPADEIPERHYRIITELGRRSKVISIKNDSKAAQANVELKDIRDKTAEVFKFIPSGDQKYYYIKNAASGKCLDVQWAKAQAGTNVWQYQCNQGNAQKWRLVGQPNGIFSIFSKLHTNLCLDVHNAAYKDGANIKLWNYQKGSMAQSFDISDVTNYCKVYVENQTDWNGSINVAFFNQQTGEEFSKIVKESKMTNFFMDLPDGNYQVEAKFVKYDSGNDPIAKANISITNGGLVQPMVLDLILKD